MAIEHKYKICDKEFTKELTPIRAIRENCIDCSGGSKKDIKNCQIEDCSLWPFRLGKNPTQNKRVLSKEHKEKLIRALERSRKQKQSKGLK